MNTFIPYSDERAAKLNEKFSSTLFGNVENFVNFYNSGMIAKREVSELTKEVVNTYKNLEEKGGLIIFLSEAEILLSETLNLLEPWVFLVKIKRELEDARDNGEIKDESVIVFSKNENAGYTLNLVKRINDENVLKKVGVERIFSKEEQAQEIFEKVSSVRQEDSEYFYFKASDFLNLDDSFIVNIHSQIPQH